MKNIQAPDILFFEGPYAIYSNFAYSPIIVPWLGDRKFYYLENAYQASKSKDEKVWEDFTNPLMRPGEAKRKGRIITIDEETWKQKRNKIMKDLEHIKFHPTYLRRKLMGTFPGLLREGNKHHDNYWGDCVCDKCQNITGLNWLGVLLMEVRREKAGL